MNLESAFLRRLPHRIRFEVPNGPARASTLGIFLKDDDLDTVDIDHLIALTEGFSGSDLKSLFKVVSLKVHLKDEHFTKAFKMTRPRITLYGMAAFNKIKRLFSSLKRALGATPEDDNNRAERLNKIGISHWSEFRKTGGMADLEEAISTARQAVDATPEDHPNRAGLLSNLGNTLLSRFNRTRTVANLETSYRCYVSAFYQSTAPISIRITTASKLISPRFDSLNPENVLQHADLAIQLLPLLTPRSLNNADKQHLLLQAAGIASDAAAVALGAQQPPSTAIAWLETGRGVLASALQDLRTDVSELHREHPDLAATFDKSRAILDAPPQSGRLVSDEDPMPAMRQETDQRRAAAKRLEEVTAEIRKQPGFDRFLLPPAESEILVAAAHGPVVMINVSRHRCDALVVQKTGIQCIELPNVSYQAIQERRQAVSSSPVILEWLWDEIVYPVLKHLDLMCAPSDQKWPRIWWIPTGPLVGFPLHAAGYHLERRGRTALDRVVSSHATSLRAMIHTRRQQQPERMGGNLILISMETTSGVGALIHADEEVQTVGGYCDLIKVNPITPEKIKSAVQSSLEDCEIFHFAGHGGTHPSQPLQSRLLLEDWKDNPLTVESLLETNLQRHPPFLAYLSACGTSQVLDDRSMDESIHLSSAFQLAGFRHVIGTLWSVNDALCVKMAQLTYKVLGHQGLSDESVSYGLHSASRQMRDVWVEGMGKEFGADKRKDGRDALLDEEDSNRLLWVPYVHYGV